MILDAVAPQKRRSENVSGNVTVPHNSFPHSPKSSIRYNVANPAPLVGKVSIRLWLDIGSRTPTDQLEVSNMLISASERYTQFGRAQGTLDGKLMSDIVEFPGDRRQF